jgi:predicted alpha/beta hydrolase family esterase
MKFVIIHGSFGSPDENWYPWLKQQLEAVGHEVLVPAFPTEDYDSFVAEGEGTEATHQTLANWLEVFEKEVLPFVRGSSVRYVAHSIGPIFTLHALREFELEAEKAFFVAPFYQHLEDEWQFKEVNKTFCDNDFDFYGFKQGIHEAHVLIGSNDPYVPLNYSEDFAEKISAQVHTIYGGGHLNSQSGYDTFPLLLDLSCS